MEDDNEEHNDKMGGDGSEDDDIEDTYGALDWTLGVDRCRLKSTSTPTEGSKAIEGTQEAQE